MEGKITYIIEHMEETLSQWIYIEYKHAASYLKDKLMITNISRKEERAKLESLVKVTEKSVSNIIGEETALVLDPKAEKPLEPEDIKLSKYVVVGGILGDHPPRGRTRKILVPRIKRPIPRSLGDKQLSIDGAVVTAFLVLEKGMRLNEIPFIDNYVINLQSYPGVVHSIQLPYRYPIVEGKVFFSRELESYITKRIMYDENSFLTGR